MTARDRLLVVLAPDVVEAVLDLVEETVEARLAERGPGVAVKRWLTVREAGEYLGCTERAVYARIRRGRIPEAAVRRTGRSVLLDRSVLDRGLSRS